MSENSPSKRCLLHSAAGPLLWSLLFLALFLGFYYLQKPSTLLVENEVIKKIFTTYGVAVGPAFALLAMLAIYLLQGFKRIFGLKKFRALNPVILLGAMVPLAVFGWELLYREKPYTDIARGIIGTLAAPLFYSAFIVCVLGLVWFVWTLIRH